ncbi:disintegrin and metalloproteinase domain-containing protein 8 isoform X3 [Salvelinus sp. IW2-2015]|uniref:disintegrin and metalloproteinase domain-containing protein 8 isoform X3 n=1 Tax=Salvelinus sp. IW2-2015 TaxID=2691554 RepID=UPI000CDFC8B5|nr:disintegrin and metalloproteinase domain-containing protein 8 isoform X1 [Salvelinus alpinus]
MRYTIYTFLLCITYWVLLVKGARKLDHVERYDVVRPQRLTGRVKRNIFSNQVYPDELQYALTIDGENHTIHLEKNRQLIGRHYAETHYSEDGRRVTTFPNYEDHCYYHGHIQGIEDSSVSVGICSGISGFVRAEQKVYLVEPLGDSADGEHALYRQEHLRANRASCGHSNDSTVYDHDQGPAPRLSGLFKSKGWKSKPITGPQRFVEMYLVADYTEYKRFGSETQGRMLEIANHVDKLYRPLNIRVMLVGLEIWTTRDHIDVTISPENTLNRFLQWRQDDLLKRARHDNAQFVTGKDFLGDTVGLANKLAMCTGSSGAVNQDHNMNPIGVASTIAHEMGHNLGMSHDTSGCTCGTSLSNDNCVMADRVRSEYPGLFSGCSQEQLSDFLERANPRCLLDTPGSDRLYVGPACGNAFLDPGEECDCGTVEECKNTCCDPTTCRLTEGSSCAHGACCENCQLKQVASLCRRASSDCDLAEYCTGTSAHCPEDTFQMNGKPCSYGQGYCYNGQCPTLQQHCKRLWGPAAQVGTDSCFNLNLGGNEGAHCGRTKNGFVRCTPRNMKCGTLFCFGGDEYPITGQKAFYNMQGGGTCNIAVDQDKIRSLDMVPTGTKCGVNEVCYDHKCQDVKIYGQTEDCSSKCHNNGVCNNKGQCHCDPDWAPPYCDVKYSDLPQDQFGVVAGISAAIAVLLLLTFLVAGLMCCKKNKRENYTSKRKVHSTSGQLNPMFRERGAKSKPLSKPPQISQPTFMESSATQACTALFVTVVPSRPPPQPPKSLPAVQPQSRIEATKPLPPSKPLPTLSSKPKIKPVVPVPPVKSSPYPVCPVKSSPYPVPPVKSSPYPVPPVKSSPYPVPPVKSSPYPVPPVKSSPYPVPPVKPSAPKQTSGGASHKIALKPPPMPRR